MNYLMFIRIRPNNTKIIHKNVFLVHTTHKDTPLHDKYVLLTALYSNYSIVHDNTFHTTISRSESMGLIMGNGFD